MPAYPKSQSLHRNREDKPKGGGLKTTSELKGGKPLNQVSKRREERLKAKGVTLNGSTFAPPSPLKRVRGLGTFVRNGKPIKRLHPIDPGDFKRKTRKALRKVGVRGKRLAPLDAKFLDDIWGIWVVCPFTGYDRASRMCEVHHCKDKSANDQWRHALWNGIPIYTGIHRLVDDLIPLKQAFERVADEQRAASEGRRPDVTPEEVRSIVLQAVPDLMERIGWAPQTKRKSKEAS
jgi:hypothetical protein